jgi:hypothetical protein
MGQEVQCKVRFGGKTAVGKALLESEELLFRGGMRLKIPFRAMKSVKSADGELRIEFPEGTAIFELGLQAQKWAEKIHHPKSLLDKLGVKPGAVVSVIAVRDERFLEQLRERTNEISEARPRSESDWIFLGAESKGDFSQIRPLTKSLKKTGGMWIVYPKGQEHITEKDVLGAGKKAGLVDVKVVSFSATHTALKFVVPVSNR